MKTKEKVHPFTGIWSVAVHEIRVAGKWELANEFEPGEWMIGFLAAGNYAEIFTPEDERSVCDWSLDEATGIITIGDDLPWDARMKCVFDKDGCDCYLYYYDDLPHIPEDAASIIAHHAHTRQKLIRVGERDSS